LPLLSLLSSLSPSSSLILLRSVLQ
jgi:hypothetical protein